MENTTFTLYLIAIVLCAKSYGQVQTGSSSNSNSTATTAATASSVSAVNETGPQQGNPRSEFASRLAADRFYHLLYLQSQVLSSLGWNSTPSSIDPQVRERLLARAGINPAAFVAVQRNCYHPACDLPTVILPEYMNRTIWFDNCSRHIRYFFHIPNLEDTGQEVISAMVKIHLKRPQDCSCAFDEEQTNSRIHIKLYQYKKPIRSHSRLRHGNMRLLDAKMIEWNGARWVTLQVTDAVRRIARGKRNGGFEVQIKNMEEEVMDAKSIIDPTECSPITEFDCTESDGTGNDFDETTSSFSPLLIIRSRIAMNSQ